MTLVNIEQIFSKGQILLSHLCSRLSVQSTQALMCVAAWSTMGFVKSSDIMTAAKVPEIDSEEEDPADDWDLIVI